MRGIMKICSVSYVEQALGCLLVPIAFPKDRQLPPKISLVLYCHIISERLT